MAVERLFLKQLDAQHPEGEKVVSRIRGASARIPIAAVVNLRELADALAERCDAAVIDQLHMPVFGRKDIVHLEIAEGPSRLMQLGQPLQQVVARDRKPFRSPGSKKGGELRSRTYFIT